MVPKLDRLARSVADLCAIEKYIAGTPLPAIRADTRDQLLLSRLLATWAGED